MVPKEEAHCLLVPLREPAILIGSGFLIHLLYLQPFADYWYLGVHHGNIVLTLNKFQITIGPGI